ncbi:hypothetical protein ACFQZE_07030 [Paenibacillus sp. GCM10027627]|uniref:hypothetical protein n=1 Tax=unclassified Paenibacillus TaxID=185978 RepID=UPI0036391F16
MKRLFTNGFNDKVLITEQEGNHELHSLNKYTNQVDVTEDFCRCIVRYCSEEVEFVVDGMRFRVTCERIE